MAKLTIEIEENEYALYDVTATMDGKPFFAGENYTSESVAFADVYDMIKIVWKFND